MAIPAHHSTTTTTYDPAISERKQAVRQLSFLTFLHYAALGFSAPFIGLYLQSVGFSGTAIGLLISVGALLELTLAPLLNHYADVHGQHRRLFRGQVSLVALAHVVFGLFAARFFVIGAFVSNAVAARGSFEMLSQLTLTRLDQLRLPIFGKIRMWGSIGWSTSTFTVGMIIWLAGYQGALLVAGFLYAIVLLLSNGLPRQTERETVIPVSASPRRAIWWLMASQFMFFCGLNAIGAFIWLHFENNLGVPPSQIGYLAGSFAIAEIIPLWFIDRFMTHLGTRRTLLIGMLGLPFVWILYGLIPSVSALLVSQLVRGVLFTMFVVAITVMVSEISHPARVATNRALIQVTTPALAMLLTSPFFGWLYDNSTPLTFFTVSAITSWVGVVLLLKVRQETQATSTTFPVEPSSDLA